MSCFHIPELVVSFLRCLPLADVVVAGTVCRAWRSISRGLLTPRTLALLHPASRFSARRVELVPDILPQVLAVSYAHGDSALLLVSASHEGVVLMSYSPDAIAQLIQSRSSAAVARALASVRRQVLLSNHHGPSSTLHAQICNDSVVIVETFVFLIDRSKTPAVVAAAVDLKELFQSSLIGAVHAANGFVFVCYDNQLAVLKMVLKPRPVQSNNSSFSSSPLHQEQQQQQRENEDNDPREALQSMANRADCVTVHKVALESTATSIWSTEYYNDDDDDDVDHAAGGEGTLKNDEDDISSGTRSSLKRISIVVAHQSLSGTKLELFDADGEMNKMERIGHSMVTVRFRRACMDGKKLDSGVPVVMNRSFSSTSSAAAAAASSERPLHSSFSPHAVFAAVTICGRLLVWDVGRVVAKRRAEMALRMQRIEQQRLQQQLQQQQQSDDENMSGYGSGDDDQNEADDDSSSDLDGGGGGARIRQRLVPALDSLVDPSIFRLYAPSSSTVPTSPVSRSIPAAAVSSPFSPAAPALSGRRSSFPSPLAVPTSSSSSYTSPTVAAASSSHVLSLQIVSDSFCLAVIVQSHSTAAVALWLVSLDGTLLRSTPLSAPSLIAAASTRMKNSDGGGNNSSTNAVHIVAVHSGTAAPHPLASAVESSMAEVLRFSYGPFPVADNNASDLGTDHDTATSLSSAAAATMHHQTITAVDDDASLIDWFYLVLSSFGGIITLLSLLTMLCSMIYVIAAFVYHGFMTQDEFSVQAIFDDAINLLS